MDRFSWQSVMKHRNAIYGICAIWIVVFHIFSRVSMPSVSGLNTIFAMGNMGVDVFLFLSAIGLSYSMEKNTIKDFYKNRFLRVVVPFLLIVTPFYIWQNFSGGIDGLALLSFFLDITSLSYWVKPHYAIWYVSFILIMYAVFPVLYKLYRKNKLYILCFIGVSVILELACLYTGVGVVVACERAFSRVPIFLFGLFLSDSIKKDKEISLFARCVLLGAFLALILVYRFVSATGVVPTVFIRYLYGIEAVCMAVVLA